ncbi:GNAT family N-acetyltransferase [Sporosalibacterium faouarense]|uniref:GNAT family N-acetyltransferase n=1 Tax=Sporosalibacterium faouarense TaxID=516123 RepID=UPI00192B2FD8|nr:GNAT family N-acetyltransferase [Sporosalibacterium faouarense]
MLRKLEENEIEVAVNLAYSLSKSPSTNSYPLRNSQEEFLDKFNQISKYPDDELLGFFIDNELIGVIYLNVLKSDLYLQTSSIFIKDNIDIVMPTFIEYLHEKYKGYEIYIGYTKENKKSINCLLSHGFQIVDSSIDQRIKRNEFRPSSLQHSIIKINQTNYTSFGEYHDSNETDIYWNSSRIKGDFNNWIIYSYWSDSQIRGSIAAKKSKMAPDELEIFSLAIDKDMTNKGIEEDLITAVLKDGFKNHNIENVLFFIESNDNNAFEYSKKLGFKVHSNYECLTAKL